MDYKIALVGEAYSDDEERTQTPFTGRAGWQLDTLLTAAGITRTECFITETFNLRPPGDDVKNLFVPKRDDKSGLPPISMGHYLDAKYLPELHRLSAELNAVRPNVVVALGACPLWAITHTTGISRSRGTIMGSAAPPGLKVLPTFHPLYVNKVADSRPIVIADLIKAKRQSEFPEIRRPSRRIHLEPTLDDLPAIIAACAAAPRLGVDIETAQRRITCIGFAVSPTDCFVIPFWDSRRGGNYWPTHSCEVQAWRAVRTILALGVPKTFQNGLFDVNWQWREYGMPTRDFTHDTMLLHHALQPEFQKGLGFLGSIYTDEPAWKLEKPKHDKKTSKKEDT